MRHFSGSKVLSLCKFSRGPVAGLALAALAGGAITVLTPQSTQTAVANGGTRTLSFYHAHRKDRITVTFRRNGRYVRSALKQLNYYMRDWRNDEQVRMDPRLFDTVWEVYRSAGAKGPITVLSSYRSPKTNSMLRRRSRRVAKNSQHMYGRALDLRMSGVNMHRVREIAMKLQRGGVGWYRSGFVHLDVGSVRAWPRMSYRQLARLFPNGRTVHISSDGRTLPGYNEARAIIARNGRFVPTLEQTRSRSFLARLFGFGGDENEEQVALTGGPAGEPASAAAFFRRDAAIRAGRRPEPVRTAARAPARKPEPKKPEPKPAEVAKPKPAPTRVANVPVPAARPDGLTPKPEVEAEKPREAQVANVPVPPRRPSDQQIAALIQDAVPDIPVPPQRPDNLIVVAESGKDGSGQPDRIAALIGAGGSKVAGTPGLPAVITHGKPVAANAGGQADGSGDNRILAYAPAIKVHRRSTVSKMLTGDMRPKVRISRTSRNQRAAPVMARAIGMRAALRKPATAPEIVFVAARFDRSNFRGMTAPQRMSRKIVHSLLGSRLMSLRAAARHDPSRLLFAPADHAEEGFVPRPEPVTLQADKFGKPDSRPQRQARAYLR